MQKQGDKADRAFLPKDPKIGFVRSFSRLPANHYPKRGISSLLNLFNNLGFVSQFSLRPSITFHQISTLFHGPWAGRHDLPGW
jgi:hypothetical protein